MKLVIYTSDNCRSCRAAKHYLKTKGVIFEERNVNNDILARKDLEDRYILSVPVLVLPDWSDGIEGFSPSLYQKFLEKHRILTNE